MEVNEHNRPESGARGDAKREEERFAALHRELYPRVRAYAMRRTMSEATADEIAAETLEIVWRRRDEPVRDQLSWTLGIARGLLANRRRGDRRRTDLDHRLAHEWLASEPDPAEAVADRSEMLVALAMLREDEREVLLLLAWDGLDRAQAARVLGCSRGALAVRLHRARRRFEGALAEQAAVPAASVPAGEARS
ncbi:MAG: sigma-70 family RNA polymerase sigma factor [Solirubrobacterales bacterium]